MDATAVACWGIVGTDVKSSQSSKGSSSLSNSGVGGFGGGRGSGFDLSAADIVLARLALVVAGCDTEEPEWEPCALVFCVAPKINVSAPTPRVSIRFCNIVLDAVAAGLAAAAGFTVAIGVVAVAVLVFTGVACTGASSACSKSPKSSSSSSSSSLPSPWSAISNPDTSIRLEPVAAAVSKSSRSSQQACRRQRRHLHPTSRLHHRTRFPAERPRLRLGAGLKRRPLVSSIIIADNINGSSAPSRGGNRSALKSQPVIRNDRLLLLRSSLPAERGPGIRV